MQAEDSNKAITKRRQLHGLASTHEQPAAARVLRIHVNLFEEPNSSLAEQKPWGCRVQCDLLVHALFPFFPSILNRCGTRATGPKLTGDRGGG